MKELGSRRLGAVLILGACFLGACGSATPGASPAQSNTGSPGTTVPFHTASSAPAGSGGTVPDVTDEELDQAEGELLSVSIGYQVDGGGTFGVVVAADWTVCDQSPSAGAFATSVTLVVARTCSYPATALPPPEPEETYLPTPTTATPTTAPCPPVPTATITSVTMTLATPDGQGGTDWLVAIQGNLTNPGPALSGAFVNLSISYTAPSWDYTSSPQQSLGTTGDGSAPADGVARHAR